MCQTESWGHKGVSLVHFGTVNTQGDQSLLLRNVERQEGTSLEAASVAGSGWGAMAGFQQGLCLGRGAEGGLHQPEIIPEPEWGAGLCRWPVEAGPRSIYFCVVTKCDLCVPTVRDPPQLSPATSPDVPMSFIMGPNGLQTSGFLSWTPAATWNVRMGEEEGAKQMFRSDGGGHALCPQSR